MATLTDLPLMLKVKDVIQVLGVSPTYAYALVNSQAFPVLHLGRTIRIPRDSFLKWLETHQADTATQTADTAVAQ